MVDLIFVFVVFGLVVGVAFMYQASHTENVVIRTILNVVSFLGFLLVVLILGLLLAGLIYLISFFV